MFETEIHQAENKWFPEVIPFLKGLFHGVWMPSHDLGHHLRVWDNAVRILPYFPDKVNPRANTFTEALLLACLFHDTGLKRDKGFRHGDHSAAICSEFLIGSESLLHYDNDRLYAAISHHDDKDYAQDKNYPDLQVILTLADDMDAFGTIGVYRYTQIYLLRGIQHEEIPAKVLNNAGQRYKFLLKRFKGHPNLTQEIQHRYAVLARIFKEPQLKEPLQEFIGRVAEIIERREDPYEWLNAADRSFSENPVIQLILDGIHPASLIPKRYFPVLRY